METLAVRRIHIDSSYKDAGDSHSDFRIRLAQSVQMPDDCIMMVDNITIPNVFKTVSERNDSLYLGEYDTSTFLVVVRKVTLTHGYYNALQFATELQTKLNAAKLASWPTNAYTVTYTQGAVLVAGASPQTFVIMSDEQIARYDGSSGISSAITQPNSANAILRNESNGNIAPNPQQYVVNNTYTSGYLQLLSVQNVFIHSSLADLCVMTPRGMSDCIACCPCSSSVGENIHHNVTSAGDAVNVSKRSFESISFQLRNSKGDIVDLHGASWSCSLLFVPKL